MLQKISLQVAWSFSLTFHCILMFACCVLLFLLVRLIWCTWCTVVIHYWKYNQSIRAYNYLTINNSISKTSEFRSIIEGMRERGSKTILSLYQRSPDRETNAWKFCSLQNLAHFEVHRSCRFYFRSFWFRLF